MGPVRGLKKRKKAEKQYEENSSASDLMAKDGPLDWWIQFSKRISGNFLLTSNTFTLCTSLDNISSAD